MLVLRFLLFAMSILAIPAAPSLLTEVSKEQIYLMEKHGFDRAAIYQKGIAAPRAMRALPPSQHFPSLPTLQSMSTKELNRLLVERETSCNACTERRELIDRVLEVQFWPTVDERISRQLTALENTPATREAILDNALFLAEAERNLKCYVVQNETIICDGAEVV